MTLVPAIGADKSRARIALVMLLLVAHGSIISAAHHHSIFLSPEVSPASVSRRPNPSDQAPRSNDPSHCATCRLQRVFNSSLRSSSISLDPSGSVLILASLSCAILPLEARIVFSGRAPPLA